MIPLSDENPTIRFPLMTVLILIGMFTVWIGVQGAGFDERALAFSVCNLGMVPGELTQLAPLGSGVPIAREYDCIVDAERINYLTPVLSLFLHGSWGPLLGNALFFCGLAASVAHIAVEPASPVPTVGASGAISGVMGAYLVLYPRVRVRMLFYFLIFFKVIPLPAWAVLLWWFGMQLLTGLPDILSPNPEIAGGVAVWAHIGGFVAGVLLIKGFERPEFLARRRIALASLGIRTG